MKSNFPAINLTDFYSLKALWELNDECWELMLIARPKQAIALCKEQPSRRLVFPTGISPNGVWGGVCKKRDSTSSTRKKEKSTPKLLINQEMLLALITASPGQSNASLALKLGITVAAVRQLVRKLETASSIHHLSRPLSSRTKLYYPGSQPSHITPKATATTRDSSVANTEEPPLFVYFVDPLTLQDICKCPNR